MKKLFLLWAVWFVTLTACETILSVDDMPEGDKWGITLNAVASPDTTFWAYVTRSYPNSDAPSYAYAQVGYEDHWKRNPFGEYYYSMLYPFNKTDDYPPFNIDKNYELIKKSTLTDAKVELIVNGETHYPMAYDTLMLCFRSAYTPAIGDRLEMRINDGAGKQTVARAEVPRPQKLEMLEINVEKWDKAEYIYPMRAFNRGYVKMKLRLHDPAGEKNYYRLAVRGSYLQTEVVYKIWDIYLSSAPLFRDDRLISDWGSWNAYFSDVFDDTLIDGKAYEFEVKAYILGALTSDWPIYEVSLQSITEDYYRYLKSLQLYRISRTDVYSEGVYIHSNNEGGWGILGAISGEVHRVELPID